MSEVKIYSQKAEKGKAPKEAALLFVTKEMLPDMQETFPCTKAVWKDFKAGVRETVTVYMDGETERLVLCGLGEQTSLDGETLRQAAAAGGDILARLEVGSFRVMPVLIEGWKEEDIIPAVLEGLLLRGYKYKGDFTPRLRTPFEEICFLTYADVKTVNRLIDYTVGACEGVELARELANAPHSSIDAERLGQVAKSLENFGLVVTVMDMEAIRKANMQGLLSVNRGSSRPATFIKLEWRGAKKKGEAPLVFVGKGLTFDTGGISLKGGNGMEAMRMDKHGGATVLGALYAAARNGVKKNVVGLVPATNNMPGPNALLPGDVINYRNGVSVEIISTDAEGRLILADGLLEAGDLKPALVVDVATLTGAIILALGYDCAGLFCEDDGLAGKLFEAGEKTGEKVWRMPMFPVYDKLLESSVADCKNGGGRPAGSTTAALFLKRFAPKCPWAHVDIAGVGMRSGQDGYLPKDGTGYGVRLFLELMEMA